MAGSHGAEEGETQAAFLSWRPYLAWSEQCDHPHLGRVGHGAVVSSDTACLFIVTSDTL